MEKHEALKRAAEELVGAFCTRKREDGEEFTSLVDDEPEWVLDAVREAHGELFPNDWSYSTARHIASGLVDAIDDETEDLGDLGHEIVDGCVDVYNMARLQWLASNLQRAFYCDEAREQGLVAEDADMFDRIGAGQYEEARLIFNALQSAIQDRAEEIEAEELEGADQ